MARGAVLGCLLMAVFLVTLVNSLEKCYKLDMEQCRGLDYNMTSISDERQWEVIAKISVFAKIAGDKCSDVLMPFLCFTLAPKCRSDIDYEIKPCQETCNRVKKDCQPVLEKLLVGWSRQFDCTKRSLFKPKRRYRCVSYTKMLNLVTRS